MKKHHALLKPKNIILTIILIAILAAIYHLESTKAGPSSPDNENDSQTNEDGLTPLQQWEDSLTEQDRARIAQKQNLFPQSPELTGISGYLNAKEGLQVSDFRGKVVLVDFWTYTCINCIRTLPYLTEWDRKYRDDGLVILGVHTPEFEFEKEYANVRMAMDKYGIEYRVVQDNDYSTWQAFKNRYWPRKYLVDADGFIRYDHIGEGGYTQTEKVIQDLLMEQGVRLDNMTTTQLMDNTPTQKLTPELYAGYGFALPRGQNIGNTGGLKPEEDSFYSLAIKLAKDVIYLEGEWRSEKDGLLGLENGSRVYLVYTAKSVNIVADAEEPVRLLVVREGKPIPKESAGYDIEYDSEGKSYILVDEPRLYNILNGEYESKILALTADTSGFSFNAFTFG